MLLRPAQAQERPGLRLAGLQRHAGPAQLATARDHLPVVGALIHEEGLALRDAAHVDAVFLEIVGEGLLDVENHVEDLRLLGSEPVENLVHVARLLDRAVEVGGEPGAAPCEGEPPDAHQAVVVPGSVVAAQLDHQKAQAIALDPVRQQHRVAVIGLGTIELGGIEQVFAAHEVPGRQARWSLGDEVISWIFSLENGLRPVRVDQEIRQVPAHEVAVVGLVDVDFVQDAVGIVKCQVKERAADQRREPGHGLGVSPRLVEGLKLRDQHLLLEIPAEFHRMAATGIFRPSLRQQFGELFQRRMALAVGQRARPDPLNAQRRLAPAGRRTAGAIGDCQLDPGAGYTQEGLRPELERHPRLYRQVVESGPLDADICGARHAQLRGSLPGIIPSRESRRARDTLC